MKELTFNKILMIFISLVWFLSLIATYITPERQFIMEYANYAFVTGVLGYIAKASIENALKISKNNKDN